jgi:hypothetical protein
MAINSPTTKTVISTTAWGVPITDEVNRLTGVAAANTPTPWTNLALVNGFTPNSTPQYRRIGDIVYVTGSVFGSATAATTLIATLPVGFRPQGTIYFDTSYYFNGWKMTTVYVAPSGNLSYGPDPLGGGPEPLSLDRLYFSTTSNP